MEGLEHDQELKLPECREIDGALLQRALEGANLPVLLMVLFHLTADPRWLREPYCPARTRGVTDDSTGGFTNDVAVSVRAAAFEAIYSWSKGTPVALPQPERELMAEMMSSCMGESVPVEYASMMAMDLGFTSDFHQDQLPIGTNTLKVLIIGAGVSGLVIAYQLRRAGIDFTIIERSEALGGTWQDNRYPGCGVDTPSHLYSFSFFPRQWSSHFAKRPEVQDYLHSMATQFDLLSSIRFNTEVVAAVYEDPNQQWRVTAIDENGTSTDSFADIVITAVGQLSQPKIPDVQDHKVFAGPQFHSSRWPEGFSVEGKKVALIGTGASAMQIASSIANTVSELSIFQRSPSWIAPNSNYFETISEEVKWLMSEVPYYKEWTRFRLAWIFNDRTYPALIVDQHWFGNHSSINSANERYREFFTQYLVDSLADRKDLYSKVLPNYPPFGKRLLIDNGWFAALKQSHVRLITSPIDRLDESGIHCFDGSFIKADVVIYATGFQAHRLLSPIEIRGRSNVDIRDVWGDDNPTAYLGMSAPRFPNMFFLYGPNTNLGHGGSYMFMAECQARYLVDLLRQMLASDIGVVECRPEVHDNFVQSVDDAHSQMVWSYKGMRTWYRNSQGRVVSNYPWRVVDYWKATQTANIDDFLIEPRAGEPISRLDANTERLRRTRESAC